MSNYRFDCVPVPRAISFGKELPELAQVRCVVEEAAIHRTGPNITSDRGRIQDTGSLSSHLLVLFGFVKQKSDDGRDSRVNSLVGELSGMDGLQRVLSYNGVLVR